MPSSFRPVGHADFDVCVIGGGIVGAAAAYALQQRHPALRILLLEKENRPAAHQTGRNSGVIHSGIYYRPGSQKAVNCVWGKDLLVAFAKGHGIRHEVCGKVIVATQPSELPHMERIMAHGTANGLTGIERLTPDGIRDIEPHCRGISGLWVPHTGIIDYAAATAAMITSFTQRNALSEAHFSECVKGIEKDGESRRVITDKAAYTARWLIVCAGLQSDRMARRDGLRPDMRIVGFRGDYYELAEHAKHKVRNLIYPVPNPEFPFLGVHFTRMTDGSVECGPNAVFTFKREGYGRTDFDLRDTAEALGFKGTWMLFAKHWRFGLNEYRRAFSKRMFLSTLQRLIPSLTMEDIVRGRSGVRAMALGMDGETIEDFRIEQRGSALHVLNAPSPAATASLAIAEQLCDIAQERMGLGH